MIYLTEIKKIDFSNIVHIIINKNLLYLKVDHLSNLVFKGYTASRKSLHLFLKKTRNAPTEIYIFSKLEF